MRTIIKIVLSVAATMLLMSGCSAEAKQPEVSLDNFDGECAEVKCWLPTQFGPKLVAGEYVSLYEQWPMDGDTVRVICVTKGGSYRNGSGKNVSTWYGILVPDDKLSEMGRESAMKFADGRVGYVGTPWINLNGFSPPEC